MLTNLLRKSEISTPSTIPLKSPYVRLEKSFFDFSHYTTFVKGKTEHDSKNIEHKIKVGK